MNARADTQSLTRPTKTQHEQTGWVGLLESIRSFDDRKLCMVFKQGWELLKKSLPPPDSESGKSRQL